MHRSTFSFRFWVTDRSRNRLVKIRFFTFSWKVGGECFAPPLLRSKRAAGSGGGGAHLRAEAGRLSRPTPPAPPYFRGTAGGGGGGPVPLGGGSSALLRKQRGWPLTLSEALGSRQVGGGGAPHQARACRRRRTSPRTSVCGSPVAERELQPFSVSPCRPGHRRSLRSHR